MAWLVGLAILFGVLWTLGFEAPLLAVFALLVSLWWTRDELWAQAGERQELADRIELQEYASSPRPATAWAIYVLGAFMATAGILGVAGAAGALVAEAL